MTTRRAFLRRVSLATAATMAPGTIEALCARLAASATPDSSSQRLVPDPAGLLDLPEGFRYRSFSSAKLGSISNFRFSQTLSDGDPVPALPAGMGAFPGPTRLTVLVRNHDLDPGQTPGVAQERAPRYDQAGTGGTTTLWVNGQGEMVRSFPSLAGTFRNAAGGATPWGTWLSAEKSVDTPGPPDPRSHDQRPDVREPHGWVFEVDARAEGLVEAAPIRAMGRFLHAGVAVDPVTGFVYLTEDREDGLLYRFRPEAVITSRKRPADLVLGDLARGGRLEALRMRERHPARSQGAFASRVVPGKSSGVDWVAIDDPEPTIDSERDPTDRATTPLRRRPRTASSAARFAHGAGIACVGRALHFGTAGGTLWRLDLATDRLSLVFESSARRRLAGVGDLAAALSGDLFVCANTSSESALVMVSPRGALRPFARNAHDHSGFAGACSSSGWLYLNARDPGITFAIQGPWETRKS